MRLPTAARGFRLCSAARMGHPIGGGACEPLQQARKAGSGRPPHTRGGGGVPTEGEKPGYSVDSTPPLCYHVCMSKAVVAVVGRPNVGKSTLFNRVVGRREAVVENIPGVTRDRLYGIAEWNGREFTIVDTGGLVLDESDPMAARIRAQAACHRGGRRHRHGGRWHRWADTTR